MHINFKSWNIFYKQAKANGINTFAELKMYCDIWGIESTFDLYYRLGKDYSAILYDQAKQKMGV